MSVFEPPRSMSFEEKLPAEHKPSGEIVLVEGQNGERQETEISIYEALRVFKKATIWSGLLSLALVMEAYDVNMLGNFYALPSWKATFGYLDQNTKTYVIKAQWQTALGAIGTCGQIIGLAINGYLTGYIGYRKTMLVFLVLLTGFLFIPFFAKDIKVLMAGQFLQGIPWGAFQTCTTAYASEIVPVRLRPYLTTWVSYCWIIGKFIAAGVLRGFVNNTTEWGWRVPLALQWIWPPLLFVIAFFAPESPWWLVRKGRDEEARKAVLKSTTPCPDIQFSVDSYLAMIKHTIAIEDEMSGGVVWGDLFRGVDRRRTLLASWVYATNQFIGTVMASQATFFLTSAGLATTASFSINLGIQGIGIVGCLLGWYLITKYNRRTVYLGGMGAILVVLIVVGILGCIQTSAASNTSWGIGGLLMLYVCINDAAVASPTYAIITEMCSVRLRAKTVALSRISYQIVGLIISIFWPYMINTTAANWGAKAAFFWCGTTVIAMVSLFFVLPETKDRTFAEIDVLFEQRTPARKFATTAVDVYDDKDHLIAQANAAVRQSELP